MECLEEAIFKKKCQFSSKDVLWETILDAASAITAEQILSLVEKILRAVISNDGNYIPY